MINKRMHALSHNINYIREFDRDDDFIFPCKVIGDDDD